MDALYFFSCVIAVASTSNATLNESGNSGHFCLAPDLSGKAFSFPMTMIFIVDVSHMA